ncbi:sensor domain-containing phosphodiesterase [Vallicoccus soli]|uniref:EAL domain-containing protein n=1 Tax=Vallicoccus soli TaxID=2339232 RepID=A0A3A3YUC0_9ACTN|nr:EAL domain-containing protein [Vallicoccus soli]RJK93392.1 EAL domain-containing protein [Vallicoccus soli]
MSDVEEQGGCATALADEPGPAPGAGPRPDLPQPARPGSALGALAGGGDDSDVVQVMLAAARSHLGMEIGFVGRFADGRRTFRFVDAVPGAPAGVRVGASDPLEETYCQRVVDGRLPRLVRDPREHPEVRDLPVTTAFPVGAHVSVPIRFSDGRVYGTFCCFSTAPAPQLRERDLAVVEMLAELVAPALERLEEAELTRSRRVARVEQVLEDGLLTTVFQPIVDFCSGRTVGYEALSRLPDATRPDVWFAEAEALGRGTEAEVCAVRHALARLDEVPAGCYLSINVSPRALLDDALWEALDGAPLERVVLELTEHVVVEDYPSIERVLSAFRAGGGRLAVDDAGAGYASMRHILLLRPDLIKLDISICRDVEADPARAAMVRSFVDLSDSLCARLVAEGVETPPGRDALQQLGVPLGQGFLFARPGPLPAA